MKINLTIFLLCFTALTFIVRAQDKPTITPTPKPEQTKSTEQKLNAKDYEDLLAMLKKGDTKIDFRKLRLAFTETKAFAPYGGTEIRKKMNEAYIKKDYNEALKVAQERLNNYYVDIDAHFVALLAYTALGKDKEAEFHRDVVKGLLESILNGADGKTAQTAYFVISIREEYFIMNYNGFSVSGQALKNQDGHTFDVLTGTNPETKETASVYFNIDKVFGRF